VSEGFFAGTVSSRFCSLTPGHESCCVRQSFAQHEVGSGFRVSGQRTAVEAWRGVPTRRR
jgi:hypothetical protein